MRRTTIVTVFYCTLLYSSNESLICSTGGVATVEIDESITDIEVLSPNGNRVSEAQLEDTGVLTFPATQVGRYVVRSSRGPVAEVEANDASAVKVLSIGNAVAHRPAILTGKLVEHSDPGFRSKVAGSKPFAHHFLFKPAFRKT